VEPEDKTGFQVIPLKTLTTRMLDLIHKQVRKPLESLSQYFRYTQQLYFEQPKDQVLDIQVTGKDSDKPNTVLHAYRIEQNYMMLVQYSLSNSTKRQLAIKYQFLQVPEDCTITESAFHMNSLTLRQTGKLKVEVVLLLSRGSQTLVRVLDLADLTESFSNEGVCQLDVTMSFKFGHFARTALEKALREERVPLIDFDERTYTFERAQSLALGRRGLLSVIQEGREVLIQEFE